MGKILDYNDYGSYPRENDLIFFCDFNNDNANPTTRKLSIGDLNRKTRVRAATTDGLKLTDASDNYGLFIKDGGNVGVGTATPDYKLDVETLAVATSNLRIYSNATNGYPHLVMQNDAQTWSIYAPHGNFTGAGVADLFSIYNGSSHTLIIQTDGNVGIGVNPSSATVGYNLEVAGDLAATGTNNVILDPSTGEIKSQSGLHLEKSASQDVYIVGDSTSSAIFAKSSNKRVGIGELSPDVKLHVKNSGSEDNSALLKLENATTSAVRAGLNFTLGSDNHFIIAQSNTVGIRSTNAALGSDSVNFQSGKIALGSTVFTRKFNVLDTSNIVSEFVSSNTAGSRILLETGTSNAAATYSSVLAHPIYEGGTKKVNWMSGAFRLSSNNYFGIHYSSDTFSGTSDIAFNGTLNLNDFYIDTSANVTVRGNVGADGFYDRDGNTVSNYCRGRFVQMFAVPFQATVSAPIYPLFGGPFTAAGAFADVADVAIPLGYNNTSDADPTAEFFSVAPYGGRIQKVTVSANNNQTAAINLDVLIWSGPRDATATRGGLPDGGSDSGLDVNNASHLTSKIALGGTAEAGGGQNNATKGYSDFEATDTGSIDMLTFDAGDWLAFAVDVNSGSGQGVITFAVEFLITD